MPERGEEFDPIALPAAEQTDNSDSDSCEGNNISMMTADSPIFEGPISGLVISEETGSTTSLNDPVPLTSHGTREDDNNNSFSSSAPTFSTGDNSRPSDTPIVTRGASSLVAGGTDQPIDDTGASEIVQASARTSTTRTTPSRIEQDPPPSCGDGSGNSIKDEASTSLLPASARSILTMTSQNPTTGNHNTSSRMDDDSLQGHLSVLSHQQSIDPDGVMPAHRANSSRKFSIDSMLGNELFVGASSDSQFLDNEGSESQLESPPMERADSSEVQLPDYEDPANGTNPTRVAAAPNVPASPHELNDPTPPKTETATPESDSIMSPPQPTNGTNPLSVPAARLSVPAAPHESHHPIPPKTETATPESDSTSIMSPPQPTNGTNPLNVPAARLSVPAAPAAPAAPHESNDPSPPKAETVIPESGSIMSPPQPMELQYLASVEQYTPAEIPPHESDMMSVLSAHTASHVGSPLTSDLHPHMVPQAVVDALAAQSTGRTTPVVIPAVHPAMQVPAHPSPRTMSVPPGMVNGYHHPSMMPPPSNIMAPPSAVMMQPNSTGKRKIHLRLMEDVLTEGSRKVSFLSFRRKKAKSKLYFATPHNHNNSDNVDSDDEQAQSIDRGRVTVSWYEGTTSLELFEHVRRSVIRKLELRGTTKLKDLRILDESTSPPEEIVLSPYIPSGSRLLLRFSLKDAGGDITPISRRPSYTGGAPDSPSAAPSPHPSTVDLEGLGLNRNQLALLGARLKSLQIPNVEDLAETNGSKSILKRGKPPKPITKVENSKKTAMDKETEKEEKSDDDNSTMEMNSLHPEDRIQRSLENITELLSRDRNKHAQHFRPRQEKRQVVFVLANYFVLFLSLIAISAEIQARAPGWNAAIEQHLNNVQNCSKDQDALFECVSNGDMAGLVASVVLWISRSAATKRIFLFGFDSPRKLWTVVYESMVTAVCWGFSYMFIRRGMNPDTNRQFLQKYWKDAVYGSLAGFNAAFMKHILRNLIPQEAIEDALQDRQLKILSWLPSLN